MTTGESNLFDFAGELVHETDLAFLVNTGGKKPVWLPKELAEKHEDGTFTIPEWLAIEKEII